MLRDLGAVFGGHTIMTNNVYRTNRHVFVVFCAQLERVYLLHCKLNVLVEFSKDVNL